MDRQLHTLIMSQRTFGIYNQLFMLMQIRVLLVFLIHNAPLMPTLEAMHIGAGLLMISLNAVAPPSLLIFTARFNTLKEAVQLIITE